MERVPEEPELLDDALVERRDVAVGRLPWRRRAGPCKPMCCSRSLNATESRRAKKSVLSPSCIIERCPTRWRTRLYLLRRAERGFLSQIAAWPQISLSLGRVSENSAYPSIRPLYSSLTVFSAFKKFELGARETKNQSDVTKHPRGAPGWPRARKTHPRLHSHLNWPARTMPTPRCARLQLPLAEVDNCAETR